MYDRKLEKTSVQLPPDVFRDMEAWTGLTRSEAIRLAVERAHYYSTLESEKIAALANEYAPILVPALQDLGYKDYRLAARAMPAIVDGFLRENPRLTWRRDGVDRDIDPSELIETLGRLDPIGRIGVLDCTVASRYPRSPESTSARTPSQRATHGTRRASGTRKGKAA